MEVVLLLFAAVLDATQLPGSRDYRVLQRVSRECPESVQTVPLNRNKHFATELQLNPPQLNPHLTASTWNKTQFMECGSTMDSQQNTKRRDDLGGRQGVDFYIPKAAII